MSFKTKVTSFFGLGDEEYMENEEQYLEQQPIQSTRQSNAVTANRVNTRQEAPVQRSVARAQVNTQRAVANGTNHYQADLAQAQQSTMRRTTATTNETVGQHTTEPKKVVNMRQQTASNQAKKPQSVTSNSNKITIVEPRAYSEAMSIAKHVISGESVLVNFHLVEEHQARRIVDFLTGAVYAEDGDIKRVADEIFLCTPKGIEIDGTAQSLVESNLFDL